MKKLIYKIVLFSSLAFQIKTIENIVTLFFYQYPEFNKKNNLNSKTLKNSEFETSSEELKQYPDFIKNKNISKSLPGITCFYYGSKSISNEFGQIIFKNNHQSNDTYILITESITPTYLVGPGLISNWNINKDTNHKIYKISFNYDENLNIYYFETKEEKNTIETIPFDTIIILGNPENVIIPEGATITNYSSNIILPKIYIRNGLNEKNSISKFIIENSLKSIDFNNYFEIVKKNIEYSDNRLLTEISSN